ncbi:MULTISPECIES: hypothetical protein [Virgibacillus]|uniref:Uncharacterized protein n=2 Tax=Virgibacillus TaxID=84406 RepID=A0A024QEF8_9BACI|nr:MULTISPECIES: hypothetical protein [Virgibacillus]EQB36646.1 hypothetical protein M948_16575 [Virgibacillus sp. CM-4]MYL42480.1 hypothetical protein [Virgibacillus massiliensis]GGJ42061.1 hypothetical protein GCM10007111_00360 [Virgibacillus kapii]CDQ40346.1 hypothetical protein BN990_02668 [Virgibacillus massiliensis]
MYYYAPYYIPSYVYYVPTSWLVRELPPVNPAHFYESANESLKLMDDVKMVLDKLSTSKEFDEKVMKAAQESNKAEVKRLIQTLHLTADVEVGFTPDDLQLKFSKKAPSTNQDCCKINIFLKWS